VKCHRYWESGSYGPFEVKAYSEKHIYIESKGELVNPTVGNPKASAERPDGTNENPVITVRHFSICHTSYPFQPLRDITQLQYPYWPDFGTTSQPTHLLHLIEQCNKVIRATSNSSFGSQQAEPKGQRPILVHCSAGCGRTGTFCTVDSVLDMLKRQRAQAAGDEDSDQNPIESSEWIRDHDLDLIEKTVEDFRKQRPSMVQNLSQFVLCYESVLEWLASEMK
jgi:protein tyrosine phosphatase